jgi:hypothetical protein
MFHILQTVNNKYKMNQMYQMNNNEILYRPMPVRYSTFNRYPQMTPIPFGLQSFNQLYNQANFKQPTIVHIKPNDDPRPVCSEGIHCRIFGENHSSKLWHPLRNVPTKPKVDKIILKAPEGETRPVCANGVNCTIHSKSHHSKLWHPPIQCKFGSDCKFHARGECVYNH